MCAKLPEAIGGYPAYRLQAQIISISQMNLQADVYTPYIVDYDSIHYMNYLRYDIKHCMFKYKTYKIRVKYVFMISNICKQSSQVQSKSFERSVSYKDT